MLTSEWSKASRSNGNGGNNCLEARKWTTSSYSGASSCVEAQHDDTVVHVRDTKDRFGPMLTFSQGQWRAWIAAIRTGQYDLPA